MLEVLYDTVTLEVRGWCGDENQFGNFKPKERQDIIILPVAVPSFQSDVYYVDLAKKTIKANLNYIPSLPRDLATEIDELKARLDNLERKDILAS